MESYQVSGALHLGLSVLEGGGYTRTNSNQAEIFIDRNSENLSTREAVRGGGTGGSSVMNKWACRT